jgi:tetratricopeptide (TPR) repeat protein
MKIHSKSLAGVIAGVAFLSILATGKPSAAVAASKEESVSAAANKSLKAAQDAIEKNDFPTAMTHLKEAEALTNRTDYDTWTMDSMELYVYSKTNDLADAEKVLEQMVDSKYMPKADLPARLRTLAQINYQNKDYDKSIQYGQRAIQEGPTNDDVYTIVAQAYYLKNDWKGTLTAIDATTDGLSKKNQPPSEDLLKLQVSACLKLNDSDCTVKAIDRRLQYYPTPENWREGLYQIIQTPGQSDPYLLQVYRLALDVDVLRGPEDYLEMATLANDQGSPGEAERILQAGQQKNVFTSANFKEHSTQLLTAVKGKVVTDQASLPKLAQDADAAKTGQKQVALGLAYFSYQQYDKAAQAISAGLAKGGVKSENDARIMLGIAQLKAGKKDDAMKTFDAVKGDSKYERLAHLWEIRAKQP